LKTFPHKIVEVNTFKIGFMEITQVALEAYGEVQTLSQHPAGPKNPFCVPTDELLLATAKDDLLSEGEQSLNSIFGDCFGDWFIGNSVSLLWEMMLWLSVQEAFEKCWVHSPLRAAARPFTRCRYCRTPALSHTACASMSTTTPTTTMTTTTRDRGDRYGPIEWAQ